MATSLVAASSAGIAAAAGRQYYAGIVTLLAGGTWPPVAYLASALHVRHLQGGNRLLVYKAA